MRSNHHASYVLGYKRATMAATERCKPVMGSQPQKGGLSSDCWLKLANMKMDLLVIPNQHVGVNAFPGLVHTACHAMGVGSTQSQWPNPQGRELPKVKSATGVKS